MWFYQPLLPAAELLSGAATDGFVKYYDGANWVLKPMKIFIGGTWQTKPVKFWDGSQWVPTTSPP